MFLCRVRPIKKELFSHVRQQIGPIVACLNWSREISRGSFSPEQTIKFFLMVPPVLVPLHLNFPIIHARREEALDITGLLAITKHQYDQLFKQEIRLIVLKVNILHGARLTE